MRRFVNAQGSEAIIRPIKNGKYRVRIKDRKGVTFVSEVVNNEADAGPLMSMHGDYWTEKAICSP